jgi:replicative DNA helicase
LLPRDEVAVANGVRLETAMHNEVRVGNLPRLLLDPEWLNALADEYLAALPNMVPTAANADYYASIVYEKSQLRNLISAGTQVVELGYSATDPADQLIAQAEAAIYAVGTGRTTSQMRPFKEMVKASLTLIEDRYLAKGTVTGIPSGFVDVDRVLGGWQKGEVILVAARPSVGKTTFVTGCFMHAALHANASVVMFSLEMSWAAIMERVVGGSRSHADASAADGLPHRSALERDRARVRAAQRNAGVAQ